MMRGSEQKRILATKRLSDDDLMSQMADIIARINDIGEDPLRRLEAQQLRRSYTAAVVRYFDQRRMAER